MTFYQLPSLSVLATGTVCLGLFIAALGSLSRIMKIDAGLPPWTSAVDIHIRIRIRMRMCVARDHLQGSIRSSTPE
jgi:hypothetical protein